MTITYNMKLNKKLCGDKDSVSGKRLSDKDGVGFYIDVNKSVVRLKKVRPVSDDESTDHRGTTPIREPDFVALPTTPGNETDRSSDDGDSIRQEVEFLKPTKKGPKQVLTFVDAYNHHRLAGNVLEPLTGFCKPDSRTVRRHKGGPRRIPGNTFEGWNRRRQVKSDIIKASKETSAPLKKGVHVEPTDDRSDFYILPYMRIQNELSRETREDDARSWIRFCMFNTGPMPLAQFRRFLIERLQYEVYIGVRKIKTIRQPNGNVRTDFWVTESAAGGMKDALYMKAHHRRKGTKRDHRIPLFELKDWWLPNKDVAHWRLDRFRTWRDRPISEKEPRPIRESPITRGIATLNVNGLRNKRSDLVEFIHVRKLAIIAIQETLIGANQYPLTVPGYEVFTRPHQDGFRGQALIIDKRYPAFEVGVMDSRNMIHVRVAGLPGKKTWHIISVYFPSGGWNRSERTDCLKLVLQEYWDILKKDPSAAVVILGDFNKKRTELIKGLKTEKSGLRCLDIVGNGLTFHRKGTKWSDIDSIVVSPTAKGMLTSAKVLREWGINSDHFPLTTQMKNIPEEKTEEVEKFPKLRFNIDLIKGHGSRIVNSNRWSLLDVDTIETTEELDRATEEFDETINDLGVRIGIKRPAHGRVFTINRTLKRKCVKLAALRKKMEQNENTPEGDVLRAKHDELREKIRKALRDRQVKLEAKEAARVSQLYADGEMRAFHRWESKVTSGGKGKSTIKPIQGKDGTLLTEPKDILNRTYEYYKDLKQDDPEKLSQNPEHWKEKFKGERKDRPLEGINDPLTWDLVLLAIRHMMVGTAPGHNDIPVEMFKAMLKEECTEALETDPGDNIYVALPAPDLPKEPLTEMGRALWRIIEAIWDLRHQPDTWSRVTDISMFKAGDPTDPKNYRGISLICVAMKIVTVMLAMRLSSVCEMEKVFVKEQGGFRSGEEAIAQFIAMAEIVRRRRLDGQKTFIVFIDFMKAFDKVMHEALFEKLDAMGIRGQILDLIKNIYRTSKACIRVGNDTSEYYDMLRGTRQGCPLSPILFLLFINDFLEYLPEGVSVPGMAKKEKCPGLLFADDVAGLADSVEMAHNVLEGVTKWSREWQMPMGAPKCNVMLINGTDEEQEALKNENFSVDGKKIEVTRSYKYLGIVITDKLGDVEQTDEMNHAETLASRVKQAVNIRRPFLKDPRFPIHIKMAVIASKIMSVGTYGGEWIAFNQKRTEKIQTQINVALKLVLGSSARSRIFASKPLTWELGLPSIEERMAELRVRLWYKRAELRTWLGLLGKEENRFVQRMNTWTKYTASQIKKTNIYFTENWIYKTLLHERKAQWYPPTAKNKDAVKQNIRLHVIDRAFSRDLREEKEVQATKKYAVTASYGQSRQYLRCATEMPNMVQGTIWLARVRIGAWWSTKRRIDTLRAMERPIGDLQEGLCPLCGCDEVDPYNEEVHIIVRCPAFQSERDEWLQGHIDFLEEPIIPNPVIGEDALTWKDEQVARHLLGGCRDDDLNDMREPAADVLRLWHSGWGRDPAEFVPGHTVHGYVPIARFLAAVMPRHKATLFPDGGRERDLQTYDSMSEEDSPMKDGQRRQTPVVIEEVEDSLWAPYPQHENPGHHLSASANQVEGMSAKTRLSKPGNRSRLTGKRGKHAMSGIYDSSSDDSDSINSEGSNGPLTTPVCNERGGEAPRGTLAGSLPLNLGRD